MDHDRKALLIAKSRQTAVHQFRSFWFNRTATAAPAPLAVILSSSDYDAMLLLLVALSTASPQPVWWADFQRAYKRCGLVFNVDGSGPAGDGVLIEEHFTGLILSSDRHRPQKPIECIAQWAKSTGLNVRYRRF